MDVQYDIKKNIPETIKAINNSYEVNQIIYYENQLACMLSSPLMFLGAIINFFHLFFHNSQINTTLLIDMTIFLLLGMSFELLRRARLKISMASWILTGIFLSWFLFIYLRYYSIIGPAVWTIAVIQIVLSISSLRKAMAITIGSFTIVFCLYTVINNRSLDYELSLYYLIPQIVLLLLLLLILSIMHRINRDRYENLYRQYRLVNDQKGEITALYEELIASEDELREQNNQLAQYNKQFIAREQKLHSLTNYDALTGLPNRSLFIEQLRQTVELCTRKSKSFYLILFDVNSFQTLNTTLDYPAGDQYLLFVTDLMKKKMQEEDILSRIDGDEFALLIRREINESRLLEEANLLRSCFSQPFLYNNTNICLSASYGISVFPGAGSNFSEVLKSADIALKEAKKSLNP